MVSETRTTRLTSSKFYSIQASIKTLQNLQTSKNPRFPKFKPLMLSPVSQNRRPFLSNRSNPMRNQNNQIEIKEEKRNTR